MSNIISPFGEVTFTEFLHSRGSFNVYRAKLYNQQIVVKIPSPKFSLNNFYHAYTSVYSSGILDFGIAHGKDKPDWWQINPMQIATGMLLAEAQVINWTAGAWNHSVIGMGTQDFLPVLIMPYHRAIPLSSVPDASKRQLFPRMLPACWDALCVAHHGDLSESNLLISENFDKFHIIDPGVLLSSIDSGGDEVRGYYDNKGIFITTAANYPIFPPFWDLKPDIAIPGIQELIEYTSRDHLMAETYWFGQSSRILDESLSRFRTKTRPSIPDLHALGIIYYRILTNQELFLGRSILPEKPAWQNSFYGDKQLIDSLSQNYIEKELSVAPITPAEKQLVSALLNLKVNSKEHLLSLVADIN